ncbi:MAG TPA: glucose 1-dehydrogenase [Ktedonobacterales bacterium]|nr:glucose 1-dehydrogenase [Ktedonobacterales bacterium]
MRAVAVFPHSREVKLIEVEEPRIAHPSEVKLRILDVGICGTDKEICAFQYGTPPDGSDYLILGHESLGEVVEVGPGVRDIAVGDLVVTMVRRPCPHTECHPCRAGRPDFCATGDFTERGIKGLHGFLTEYVVDDARYMHVVPAALRKAGVLTEPLTIAEKAFAQAVYIERRMPWLAGITPQSPERDELTAAILGAGAVGLLGALALRAMGIETYVYDRVPPPNAKSRLVELIGAHYVSPADSSMSFTDLIGHVHFIYEATGVSQLAFQAIMALRPNSILVFTGVPGQGAHKEMDTDTLMRNMVLKNQVILGTVNADAAAYASAIRHIATFVERWPQAIDTVIADRYPLDAYRDLLLGQTSGIKNVLSFEAASQA